MNNTEEWKEIFNKMSEAGLLKKAPTAEGTVYEVHPVEQEIQQDGTVKFKIKEINSDDYDYDGNKK